MTINKKIAALDLGDKWIGVALSDPLRLFARPHTTVEFDELMPFLVDFIAQEQLETIVLGLPLTLRSTESVQTQKIRDLAEILKQTFPNVQWVLWDERLSSKQASTMQKTKTKEDKKKLHAMAAAIVLNSYLEFLQFQKNQE